MLLNCNIYVTIRHQKKCFCDIESEFLAAQEAFLTSNILQSHQIAELQEERNHYNKVERLLFLEDEQVIGLAVVDYRKNGNISKKLWSFKVLS